MLHTALARALCPAICCVLRLALSGATRHAPAAEDRGKVDRTLLLSPHCVERRGRVVPCVMMAVGRHQRHSTMSGSISNLKTLILVRGCVALAQRNEVVELDTGQAVDLVGVIPERRPVPGGVLRRCCQGCRIGTGRTPLGRKRGMREPGTVALSTVCCIRILAVHCIWPFAVYCVQLYTATCAKLWPLRNAVPLAVH